MNLIMIPLLIIILIIMIIIIKQKEKTLNKMTQSKREDKKNILLFC